MTSSLNSLELPKVGRGNSGHEVIRATSMLQQERSIHWILASSECRQVESLEIHRQKFA